MKKHENYFNFREITNFTMDIQDIYKFENKYNVKIYLFEISKNKVVRAHMPKTKINAKIATHVINLSYFNNNYILIKHISRL